MAKKNVLTSEPENPEQRKKQEQKAKGDIDQPKTYQTDMMVSDGKGKRLATIQEEAELRTQNLNLEVITSHQGDNHTFEISNMTVESAMEDLDRACNYRTGGQYSSIIKDMLADKYLLFVMVDGQPVQKVISQEDHDRFLKADEANRLDVVRQILDIAPEHVKRGQDVENLVVQVKSTNGRLSTDFHVFDDDGLRRFEDTLGHKLIPPKPQIFVDAKADIQKQQNDYKVTVVLDGKVYNGTITGQQHDRMMAMDDGLKVNFLQKILPEANIKGQLDDVQQTILQTLNSSLYNLQKPEVYASATQNQGSQQTMGISDQSDGQSFNSSLRTRPTELAAAAFESLENENQQQAQAIHQGLGM